MKSGCFSNWGLAVGVVVAFVVSGRLQAATDSPSSAGPLLSQTQTRTETGVSAEAEPAAEQELAPPDLADAAVTPLTRQSSPPPNINPSVPVSEIIRLANAGVDQNVMLAYVKNSTSLFDVGAEDIIYLNDIGVPAPVITAMIQHDHELRASGKFVETALPPSVNPEPTPVPAPSAVAPQPAPGAPPTFVEQAPPPPAGEVVDDSEFYDSLAPYGTWVDVAGYGRCWQPTVVGVNPGWQPYFDCGHWVYTDCGWYWLSDYSWGWAPFHYGRWFRHNHLGWCWAPGRVWGPSWVCWRYTDDYCGWAPLPPGAFFSVGIGLTFGGRAAHENEHWGLRADHFHFVAWNHFHDRALRPHGLGGRESLDVFNHSRPETRITGDHRNTINNGLPVAKVSAATRTTERPVVIHDSGGHRPETGRAEVLRTGGRSLEVYRPRLTAPPASRGASQGRQGSAGGPAWSPVASPAAPVRPAPAHIASQSAAPGATSEPNAKGRREAVNPATPNRGYNANRLAGNTASPPRPAAPAVPAANPAPVRNVDPPWMRAPAATADRTPRSPAAAPEFRNPRPVSPAPSSTAPARVAPVYQIPQAPARTAQADVPRYTAPPAPRYSPPAASAPAYRPPPVESRPAPSAQPAPSAPSRPSADSRPSNNQGRQQR